MNPRHHKLSTTRRCHTSSPRRGSVLVVVLALLAALMLLGFLFFTLASQERENARYFTASEKWYSAQLDADTLFDFALEQIIVGPQDDLVNSALWGGRYSLLAGIIGKDIQPYSGAGINIVDQGELTGGIPNGVPVIDRNRDGIADSDNDSDGDSVDDMLRFDLAHYVVQTGNTNLDTRPFFLGQPDVGYSYPDLNSPFLSYIGKEPMTGNTVIIPSFHRPQYLRGMFGTASAPTWYADPRTLPYVMRPHAERTVLTFNYDDGSIVDTGLPRFTDPTLTNPSVVKEGYWGWNGTDDPTAPDFTELDVDADNDGIKEAMVFDLGHPVEETPDGTEKFIPIFGITIYDLDGLINLNAHGNLYGPAESLVSQPAPGNPFGFGQFISKGNEGRTPAEINPQYGMLDADHTTAGAEHSDFFLNLPRDAVELANMETWFIMAGRADFKTGGGIEQLYPGKWGDPEILAGAINATSQNAFDYPRPGISKNDEVAGETADARRGLRHADVAQMIFPNSVVFERPVHPEDHQGQGTYVLGDGKTPVLNKPIPNSRAAALRYLNYWLPVTTDASAPLWQFAQGINGVPVNSLVTLAGFGLRALAAQGYAADGYLIDNPGETLLDPELARDQVTDSIFGADEAAFMHMATTDIDNNGIVSRLLNLVPANFREDPLAEERRKRYTTISADLKAYSLVESRMNPWEYRNNLALLRPDRGGTFPPLFGSPIGPVEAFRPEAIRLLQQEHSYQGASGPVQNELKGLIRKLSVNHVVASVRGGDGRPRYHLRPLTPHPVNLPSTALTALLPAGWPTQFGVPDYDFDGQNEDVRIEGVANNGAEWPAAAVRAIDSAAKQEWHARRDRQNLARDIYTLLYTLGDADATGGINPTMRANTPAGSRPVYSDEQLAEMAQFAVNLVDAMDPDDTVTAFVYDKNLYDGYTTHDNAYIEVTGAPWVYDTTTGFYNDPVHDRGLVFGVEAQKLAINEALAVFAKRVEDTSGNTRDHAATEWDDEAHRDFTYVELRNLTPYPESLDGSWSIVVDPTAVNTSAVSRALTIRRNTAPGAPAIPIVQPGGLFTIGVAGDANSTERPAPGDPRPAYTSTPNNLLPSFMKVDPEIGATGGNPDFPDFPNIAGEDDPVVPYFADLSGPDFLDPATGFYDPMRQVADSPNNYRVNNIADPTRPDVDGAIVAPDSDSTSDPSIAGGPSAGLWLDLGSNVDPDMDPRNTIVGGETVKFFLRRRLNLNRDVPPQDSTVPTNDAEQLDNPWIIVDEFQAPLRKFELTYNGNADEVKTQLLAISSGERLEALDRGDFATAPNPGLNIITDTTYPGDTTPEPYRLNRLGADAVDTSVAANRYNYWQRHFDRSFSSLGDVLNVPLYGPRNVTARLTADTAATFAPAVQNKHQIAAKRILFPDQSGIYTNPPVGLAAQNLWFRLFEFAEVPSKYGDKDGLPWFAHYGGPAPWGASVTSEELRLRQFGKLNINTMRHPHVLAGLLNDPNVFQFMNERPPVNLNTPGAGRRGYLPSSGTNLTGGSNSEQWLNPNNGRDWWLSMLASRDGGFDQYSQSNFGQNLVLPGVPSAKPFLGFAAGTDFSRTVLRPMPDDVSTLRGMEAGIGRRSLFELGTYNSAASGNQVGGFVPRFVGDTDTTQGEFATRYRLLGKVLNHGTTRSNTFMCFLTCDFYKATGTDHDGDPYTPDVFQIGEKISDKSPGDAGYDEPKYRGAFVIDRSLALQMIEKWDLPGVGQTFPPSQYDTYSFNREIGTYGRPQPTFDWRKLIQYRKIIKND